jgi:hypothetical protein
LDASAIPPNVPFWRTYKEDDKYSLVITAGAVFKDVPDLKTATTPRMTRADAASESNPVNMPHPADVKSHTSVIISCRTLAPVVQKPHRIMAGLSQAGVFVYSM